MRNPPAGHIRIDPDGLTAVGEALGALGRGPLHEAGVRVETLLLELDAAWGGPARVAFRKAGGRPVGACLQAAERDLERIQLCLTGVAAAYARLERDLALGDAAPARRSRKPPGLSRSSLQEYVGPPVYVIVAGDTLWDIANRFDTTVEALRAANGIAGHLIYPGQRLIIAQPQPPMAAPEPPVPGDVVIVRAGDTLWGIAVAYGITVADLRAANGITGDLIYPGQRLRLPAAGEAPPSPILRPGAALLLADAFVSGYAWQAHPGHYAVDLSTLAVDKTLRAPYAGTRIVADPCPALTADGNVTGRMAAGQGFGPENNWGYGALTVVESRYEDLTAAQVADLAMRGASVQPGQSLYVMIAHLQPDQVPEAGTVLQAGDPIAQMGTSGNSTGPHAHVEIAVTVSGLRPGEGQNSASFWIGAVVGVSNGAAAPGTRIDPTPLFGDGP